MMLTMLQQLRRDPGVIRGVPVNKKSPWLEPAAANMLTKTDPEELLQEIIC